MYGKMIIRCCLVVRTGLHIGAGNAFSAIGAVDSQVVRDPLTGLPMDPRQQPEGQAAFPSGQKSQQGYPAYARL